MANDQPLGKHARHAAPTDSDGASRSRYAVPSSLHSESATGARGWNVQRGTRRAHAQTTNTVSAERRGDYPQGHLPQDNADISAYRADRYIRKKRRGGLVLKRVALGIFAALLLYIATLGISAFSAYKAIDGIRGDAALLKSNVLTGDYVAAQQSVRTVASKVASANSRLSNPLWAPTTVMPFIGKDIKAVRTILDEGCSIVDSALVPAVDDLAASGAGPFVREDDSLDADAIKVALQAVGGANAALSKADNRLATLQTCSLGQVDGARRSAIRIVDAVDRLSFVAPQLASRVHWLLGAEGETRSFLMLAQNNVEIRATGGYPGSLGPVYISNGKLEMGDFVAVTSLGRFDMFWHPVADYEVEALPISEEEATLFGTRVVNVPGDFGYNPSFPRDAENWKHIWEVSGRGHIDGVVAIDPVFLQTLLGVFGEVTTSDGLRVGGDNAAKVLMYDTYRTYDSNEAQDALFVEVAELAFDKMTTGLDSVDMVDFSKSVWRAGSHGRLKLWFADSDTQYAFAHLGFAGDLSHDVENPVLGIYYNDDSWSKMFWYFEPHSNILNRTKNADGSTSYRVKTTLTNRLKQEEQDTLPRYVIGHSPWCESPGDMVMWLHLVAPAGGSISNVSAEGVFLDPDVVLRQSSSPGVRGTLSVQGMNEGSYEDLDVWYCMTKLGPGQTTTVAYTVTTDPNARSDLKMLFTPSALEVAGW